MVENLNFRDIIEAEETRRELDDLFNERDYYKKQNQKRTAEFIEGVGKIIREDAKETEQKEITEDFMKQIMKMGGIPEGFRDIIYEDGTLKILRLLEQNNILDKIIIIAIVDNQIIYTSKYLSLLEDDINRISQLKINNSPESNANILTDINNNKNDKAFMYSKETEKDYEELITFLDKYFVQKSNITKIISFLLSKSSFPYNIEFRTEKITKSLKGILEKENVNVEGNKENIKAITIIKAGEKVRGDRNILITIWENQKIIKCFVIRKYDGNYELIIEGYIDTEIYKLLDDNKIEQAMEILRVDISSQRVIENLDKELFIDILYFKGKGIKDNNYKNIITKSRASKLKNIGNNSSLLKALFPGL